MPFLSETVYDYISTNSYSTMIPESNIPDVELQSIVCQVNMYDYIWCTLMYFCNCMVLDSSIRLKVTGNCEKLFVQMM